MADPKKTADGKSPPRSRSEQASAPHSLQGNHGTFSDDAPGLVAPTRLNEGDTGAASDKPEAGGQLNFDDGDMTDGGYGNNARTGGTWSAQGADSAPLGKPAEILSRSNKPSDRQNEPEDTPDRGPR